MIRDPIERLHRSKLGAIVNAKFTCNGTVDVYDAVAGGSDTPLPEGAYVITADVDAWVLQCNAAYVASNPDATALRAIGVKLNAGDELDFVVDDPASDGYILFVKDAAASDGQLWINYADKAHAV